MCRRWSLLSIALLAALICGAKSKDGDFCQTNTIPSRNGTWLCDSSWFLQANPPVHDSTFVAAMMGDGDETTETVFPPVETRRELIFQLPDYYVVEASRIRINTEVTPNHVFTIYAWNDTTFETPGEHNKHFWIEIGEYRSEYPLNMVKIADLARLSKYWKIELPIGEAIPIQDITFLTIANLPSNGDLNNIQFHFESMRRSGEEIDPESLSEEHFQSAAAAPTSNTCGQVVTIPQNVRSFYGIRYHYTKYTTAYGVPIMSSHYVKDTALQRACYTVRFMLADHARIRDHMYKNKGRVSVITISEHVTTLPEYRHLRGWTHRAAGGTMGIPVTVGAEENILCDPRDPFSREQDILLHEFAHGVQLIAAATAIPDWQSRLQRSYLHARSQGLWSNTYANTNNIEYFAETTMAYFNQQRAGRRGGDGIQNDINTRDKLYRHDPTVYKLIEEIFPCRSLDFIHRCDDISQARGLRQELKMNCNAGGTGTTGTGTGGSGGCVDRSDQCAYWMGQGYCSVNAVWTAYMDTNCPKSCGKCKTPNPKPEPTPVGCKDTKDDCEYWKGENMCTEGEWVTWMTENCPKSCGTCNGPVIPVTTTTASTTTTTVAPPIVRPTACLDEEDCAGWHSSGYCTDSTYSEYMSEHCPKVCGKCEPECKDNDVGCVNWKKYCLSNTYTKDNCKKTCNTC